MGDVCPMETVQLQFNGIVRNEDGEIIGRMGKSVSREAIHDAVCQAWCSKENENKEMDVALVSQIVSNVVNLW